MKQRVGVSRDLFGDKHASFVKGLYEALFVVGSREAILRGLKRVIVLSIGPYSC